MDEFPFLRRELLAFSSLFSWYNNVAVLRDRGNMEAINNPHGGICSRGCKFDACKLSEEGSDKYTHFEHGKVDRNASSCTR